MLGRALAFLRGDVPARQLAAYGRDGVEAYDLVDRLPRGRARAAAWNAYVFQTYADKLLAASRTEGFVSSGTAEQVETLYHLVARAEPDTPLPRWGPGVHSTAQLAGMRDTLGALRTYVAFDLASLGLQTRQLAAIDACIDQADGLWIRRPSVELRGGIGDALASGLEKVSHLGQLLAAGDFPAS